VRVQLALNGFSQGSLLKRPALYFSRDALRQARQKDYFLRDFDVGKTLPRMLSEFPLIEGRPNAKLH
jgi:hypothetical protein